MARAVWAGAVLAESEDTIVVDGYTYFPLDAVRWQFLKESEHQSVCGWKGVAKYWDIEVEGQRNQSAVWSYSDPKPAAKHVTGRVGFWRGVVIER